MSLNNLIVLTILFGLFVLSGYDHRTLYFLYPFLGALFLLYNNFKLKGHPTLLIRYFIPFCIIFCFQILLYFEGWFSVQGFLRYIVYLLLFIFIYNVDSLTLRLFIKLITILLFISIPYGFYVSQIQHSRFEFIFDHSNHLAYVCVLLTLYFLVLFKSTKAKKYAFIALIGIVILFSKSTGGLLTYSILIIYNIFGRNMGGVFKKLVIIVPTVFLLIVLMSLSDRFIQQLAFLEYYNFSFILERVEGHQAGGVGSGLWRIIHWLSILANFFNEHIIKILFGLGFDTMTRGHYHYSFMITDPHNDFVKIFVEIGIIGFIIFLYLYRKFILYIPKTYYFLIVTLVPMMLGNIIVNFPYMFVFTIIIVILLKEKYGQYSPSYTT